MKAPDFSRLLQPRSIAIVGGGAWCEAVIRQCQLIGFDGDIWPVHPSATEVAGQKSFQSVSALSIAPDACFIGVNRHATIEIVRELAKIGAGGAVCFASGFSETMAEDARGDDLQDALVRAADGMPILGPNCYGFINALDGALLWPDQHGMAQVDSGVAILTQSSNIAVNLTMQQRALPIAYMITCGNMAQTSQAEIALALLDDPRVTAIGLHIEGFSDLRAWEALAQKAYEKSIPLIALKVGKSEQARTATVSHTASLAGSDAGAAALLVRLGIGRVNDLPTFLETLKLLHIAGPLGANTLASISCSGGEASLAADTAVGRDLSFPPLNPRQSRDLANALGPKVALANPLDYHTYIWRDTKAMAKAWAAIVDPGIALTLIIVDYPHTDASDWVCATNAALAVRAQTDANIAVVTTLPELMPAGVAAELMAGGVIPMQGLSEAIAAAEIASGMRTPTSEPLLLPEPISAAELMPESEAKTALAHFDLSIPHLFTADSPTLAAEAAGKIAGPVALKGTGLAHKSEAGAVKLGLWHSEIAKAAAEMPCDTFLVEEMITGGVAELLVGVVRDPAHGFVLTIAAGGVLTELMQDSCSLLMPVSRAQANRALMKLRIAPLLSGYRGATAANLEAIIDAISAVQAYVLANADTIEEVEINPLICTPDRAVAVDALIRKVKP